jgi:hypothetical protein
MFRFQCPFCGKKVSAPEEKVVARNSCPGCKKPILVPALPSFPKNELPTPQAKDYPRLRRSLALIRARRKVRAILDLCGFGASVTGRLCLALILCTFLFGVSLAVSLAIDAPPTYAIAQAMTIFITAFVSFLVLVLGPDDEGLVTQLNYVRVHLPKAEAAWRERKNELAAERLRQQERADKLRQQERAAQVERANERRERKHQQQVIWATGETRQASSAQLYILSLRFIFFPCAMILPFVVTYAIDQERKHIASPIWLCLTAVTALVVGWWFWPSASMTKGKNIIRTLIGMVLAALAPFLPAFLCVGLFLIAIIAAKGGSGEKIWVRGHWRRK